MKKTYIIPTLQLTEMSVESLIADSLTIDGTVTATGTNGGWVKENRGSRQDYNVWNDDWSE